MIFRLSPTSVQIDTDPGQIEQVLLRLVANAREALPGGGTITIETVAVEIVAARAVGAPSTQHLERACVTLTVNDGGGLGDAATVQRILEPCFTAEMAGNGARDGLSQMLGMIRKSGGTIHVSSEPGHGSVYTISLPRGGAAPAEEAAAAVQAAGASHTVGAAPHAFPAPRPTAVAPTILVTEDEQSVRKLVRMILQQAGYAVLEAADGQEALDLLRERGDSVHLLLTDLSMPGMGGRQLGDRAAEIRPDLPILYVSGHAHEMPGRDAGDSRRVAVLSKPFTREQLSDKVREMLHIAKTTD